MERADAHFATKITQQPIVKTHEVEGILEGESLSLSVLCVGGRHCNARERKAIPRQAEYSCLSGILFFYILMAMYNK